MLTTFSRLALLLLGVLLLAMPAQAQPVSPTQVHDLSLLVSPRWPCVWPTGMQQHAVVINRTFGSSAQHRDMVIIDEHTGTQWDAPAHFVPPPDSGLPGAGPNGLITGEKVPAWQFCGEACVIDVSDHIDDAPAGSSYLIRPEIVQAWEKTNRPLRFGDVVLFRSGYSDEYYQPFPRGERFVTTALRKLSSGWPAPTPETMTYLGSRGVMSLGLDGASMGPLPDLAVATHQAGGKLGMIWTECATNLGTLPTTGAFYAILPAKHAGGSGGECRAIGITDLQLAARLNDAARHKRVADLTVTMADNLPITWPGLAAGDEAPRYVSTTLNKFDKARGPYFARTHTLDSQAGTHVVLPSASLPPSNFDVTTFTEPIQKARQAYEARYGALGTSDLTLERLPLADTMGEAHVVDVTSLKNVTEKSQWPASPQISATLVKEHHARRPFKAGEVVIFYSGYSDARMQPLPEGPDVDQLLVAPLAGTAEGWPAVTPEALAFLAECGVKCVATDGPTLGGTNPDQALQTAWMAASRKLLVIEFLTNVKQIADRPAYLLFAPIKIEGLRAGYGRAIALYDEESK